MSGFRLGRIFGIDVHVHGSWFIIVALVMWSLATSALPADFPEIAAGGRLVMASVITLLFFVSLLAHELGHSVVAIARGIPVQRITFFLFGGMAQTSKDSRSPGEEFAIAIAGPLTSLLLASLCLTLWYVGQGAGWSPMVVGGAVYIGVLNLVLGLFNMLPGFPMDGGRVLRAAVWKATGSVTTATRWASRVGVGMAWLLIAYGLWLMLEGDVMGGVWLVFIAAFIRSAARSSYRQHLLASVQRLTQEVLDSHGRPDRDPRSPGGHGMWPGRGDLPSRDRAGADGGGGGRDVTRLGHGGG